MKDLAPIGLSAFGLIFMLHTVYSSITNDWSTWFAIARIIYVFLGFGLFLFLIGNFIGLIKNAKNKREMKILIDETRRDFANSIIGKIIKEESRLKRQQRGLTGNKLLVNISIQTGLSIVKGKLEKELSNPK